MYYYYSHEVCYKGGIKRKNKPCWTAQTGKTQTGPKRKNISNYILSTSPVRVSREKIIVLPASVQFFFEECLYLSPCFHCTSLQN